MAGLFFAAAPAAYDADGLHEAVDDGLLAALLGIDRGDPNGETPLEWRVARAHVEDRS